MWNVVINDAYIHDTYSRQQDQSESCHGDTLSSDSDTDVDSGSLANLREMFPDQKERVLREALQENLDFDAAVDHVNFVAGQNKGR